MSALTVGNGHHIVVVQRDAQLAGVRLGLRRSIARRVALQRTIVVVAVRRHNTLHIVVLLKRCRAAVDRHVADHQLARTDAQLRLILAARRDVQRCAADDAPLEDTDVERQRLMEQREGRAQRRIDARRLRRRRRHCCWRWLVSAAAARWWRLLGIVNVHIIGCGCGCWWWWCCCCCCGCCWWLFCFGWLIISNWRVESRLVRFELDRRRCICINHTTLLNNANIVDRCSIVAGSSIDTHCNRFIIHFEKKFVLGSDNQQTLKHIQLTNVGNREDFVYDNYDAFERLNWSFFVVQFQSTEKIQHCRNYNNDNPNEKQNIACDCFVNNNFFVILNNNLSTLICTYS
jgi:hypothetical protein